MSIIEKAVDKMMGGPEGGAATARPAQSRSPVKPSIKTPAKPPVNHQTKPQVSQQARPQAKTAVDSTAAQQAAQPPNRPQPQVSIKPKQAASAVVQPEAKASPVQKPVAADMQAKDEAKPSAEAPSQVKASEDKRTTPIVKIADLNIEGILSPDHERTRAAEEYRMIKRPLLTAAFDNAHRGKSHSNLIMVTSSVEGEGKSFSTLNLAISIAMEMDRTVLVVDADLAKPGLSRMLDIDELPGMTDRLQDDTIDLKDVLVSSDVPNLTFLPAGRRHRRSTELLSSNAMASLLDELALRYPDRVVLFDSPPLLATSEASVLAQQMGQICLVVESAVTPQFLVKDALNQLQSTDNVSLMLNKCKPEMFLKGYGYSYRYGYSYGHDTE